MQIAEIMEVLRGKPEDFDADMQKRATKAANAHANHQNRREFWVAALDGARQIEKSLPNFCAWARREVQSDVTFERLAQAAAAPENEKKAKERAAEQWKRELVNRERACQLRALQQGGAEKTQQRMQNMQHELDELRGELERLKREKASSEAGGEREAGTSSGDGAAGGSAPSA